MQKRTNKHLGALVILHEDNHLLVVDKPPGLLTMGTETDRTRTAYFKLTDYVRRGNPKSRNRIFIVHRLDRETSGVLVFAKSHEVKAHLQEHWETTKKTYLAIVHGTPSPPEGTITSYLAENLAHQVFTTRNPAAGKLAKTNYKVLSSARGFSLLEIDLLTGRNTRGESIGACCLTSWVSRQVRLKITNSITSTPSPHTIANRSSSVMT